MGVCFIINHTLIKDGDVDMDPSSQTEFNPRKTDSAHSNFTWLRQIIFQPGQAFTGIVSEERKKNWLFPILVVSVLIICAALISTFLTTSTTTPATSVRTTQSAQTTRTVTTNRGTGQNQGGQVPGGFVGGMPPGGEFPAGAIPGFATGGTTTTNTNSSASSSSTNIWLSLIWPVASFIITWLLVGGLTSLFSLAFGGSSHSLMALNIAAWASIPIGVRNLMQIVYYLASGAAIQSPGLSGFVSNTSDNTLLLFSQFLLARVDIYLFWQIALLAIGVGIWGGLARKKAVVIAVVVILVVILLQSLVGLGVNLLGNVNINTNMLLRMR